MTTHVVVRIATGLALWAIFGPGSCIAARGGTGEMDATTVAMDAYKLRMQGQVEDAREMLEQAVRENPNNAVAQYELARTILHMALGRPNQLSEALDEAQQAIARAEEVDPSNVIYPFFDGHIALLQAYPSLMQSRPDAREKVARLCGAFELALKLKPDYREAMLYLVEIYGTLPPNQGGDKSKAQMYAGQLEKMDAVYGAKARSILLSEDANNVVYWQNILQKHDGDADVLEELGKAYLRADKVDDAVACFERAIKIDPSKAYLFLDLSIYYTWSAMRAGEGSDSFRKAVAAGDAAVGRYLDFKPVLPMRAYALGVQYKYRMHSDLRASADDLLRQAEALDPYFSKATGAPNPDLFIPPDEVSQNHRYLFRSVQ